MSTWQLEDAQARLGEIVELAVGEGPQAISVKGHPIAVVVGYQEFLRLTLRTESLVDFLRKSPLNGSGLESSRDRSPTRDVEF
jgi:prevent-host-death family protein